ncbi:MAG: hypothetical protein FH756_16995 [Firmicutes bacterium]|nr:hypothetical protein [Bacillota bacterium]
MTYNPDIHHRRSIRLPGYEYSRPGSYFITVCTQDRKCLFGRITNDNMILNKYGKIANDIWFEIPVHFPHVQLDEFIVMPNHIHGIIAIVDANVGARHAVPQRKGP